MSSFSPGSHFTSVPNVRNGFAGLILLASTACALAPPQRHYGPEIVEKEWEEEVREPSLELTVTREPTRAPGQIRGQVTDHCEVVARQEVRRTDRLEGKQGRNIIRLAAGLALSAGGIALLATAPEASSPRGRAIMGALFLAPGLGLTAYGTIGAVRSRKRTITERYTKEVPVSRSCSGRPVEGVTVFLTAPDLGIARSPMATTGKGGSFEFTLLGPAEGLRYLSFVTAPERRILDEHGINFPIETKGAIDIVLDVSIDPVSDEEDPIEDGERDIAGAQELPSDRVMLTVGDWITEPARRLASPCRAPSSNILCQAAIEELKAEHSSYEDALVFVEVFAKSVASSSLGTYKGSFRNGLRHGQGTVTFPNGRRYEGRWKNGRYHGQGTFTTEAGDRYSGQWKDGMREGYGVFTDSHGLRYKGYWKENNFHGQGHLVSPKGHPNGQVEYRGQYVQGEPSGKGTATFPDYRYEGHWSDGWPNGQGTKTTKSGLVIDGMFKDGQLANGKRAVIRWPDGRVWEGKWTPDMDQGGYRFENIKHRSPDELYVQAGRLLDDGDELGARLIFRYITDKHPSSAAARRAVDRLASMRERRELEALHAEQVRALEEAERNRMHDEQIRRRQAHDDARRSCLASCQGKSHEGLFSDYNACVSRCP